MIILSVLAPSRRLISATMQPVMRDETHSMPIRSNSLIRSSKSLFSLLFLALRLQPTPYALSVSPDIDLEDVQAVVFGIKRLDRLVWSFSGKTVAGNRGKCNKVLYYISGSQSQSRHLTENYRDIIIPKCRLVNALRHHFLSHL